jgi:hypothetical protein
MISERDATSILTIWSGCKPCLDWVQPHGSTWPRESPTYAKGSRGCTVWSGIDCRVSLLAGTCSCSATPSAIGWRSSSGTERDSGSVPVRERAFHLAAIRRCAGEGRPKSRRALSTARGIDLAKSSTAQALVPESITGRTCCGMSCLSVSIDSGKSVTCCECASHSFSAG